MRIEVWADIVDPWSFIGIKRLDAAVELLAFRDQVELVHRAIERDPGAAVPGESMADHLTRARNISHDEALYEMARATAVAAGDSIALRYDDAHPVATFDLHRVLRLAAKSGAEGVLFRRFAHAALCDGVDLGDREAVVRLAASAQLDGDEVRSVLATDRYADEVRIEIGTARDLGATTFPFVVLDRVLAMQGPQSVDELTDAIQNLWDERRGR